MDPLGLIKILRKLQAYLAGLLPRTPMGRGLSALGSRLGRWPLHARVRERVQGLRLWQAGQLVVKRFVWRDHSGDQLHLDQLPASLAPVLRVCLLFVALVLLSLLVVRLWPWPPLEVSGMEGFEVPRISALSLHLCLAAVALGWAAVLTGAARANFWAFLAASVALLYQVLPLGLDAPLRAPLVLVPLALLWALSQASEPVVDHPLKRALLGIWPALALAKMAGVLARSLTGSTPVEVVVMALVGAAVVFYALRITPGPRASSPGQLLLLLTLALGTFLGLTLLQLGQHGMLEPLQLHLSSFDGYLWMVWYFLGVGIVFKLLSETKALSQALDLVLPGRWLQAVGLGLLSLGLLLGFAQELITLLARLLPEASWLLTLYRLWQKISASPAWFETLLVMRWVLLTTLGLLIYLRARELLTRDRALRVAYLLLLALLVVYEYHFELYSFRGSPAVAGQRLLAPVMFGVWILWLFYAVGMRAASGDSRGFSRQGRTAIFCGVFVLGGAVIHFSAVSIPAKLADRTFLQLFLGLMHVGLPYFLYVYLGKRFKGAGVSTPRLAGAFALGLLAQVPVLLLGKLALGGYSLEGFGRVVRQLETALLSSGGLPADLEPPSGAGFWLLAVGLGTALRLGALALARFNPVVVVAVYTGYGAAAVMPLSLPLFPPAVLSAIYPLEKHLTLTLALATHHALHLLLALVLALALARRRRGGLALGLALAMGLELLLGLARGPVAADYLRDTGLEWSLLVGLAGAAALLFWRLDRRLSLDLTEGQVAPPLVPAWHVALLACAMALATAGGSLWSAHQHRLRPAALEGVAFGVPSTWTETRIAGVAGAWAQDHFLGRAVLLAAAEPVPAGASLEMVLKVKDAQFAAAVSDFSLLRSRRHGALLWREATFTVPAPDGQLTPRQVLQGLLLRHRKLLSWTCMANAGPAFAPHAPGCRRALRSVQH